MSQLNSQVVNYCLTTLKQTFKNKGITYNDIAQQLGLSLATVKRLMADPNIRFERLLALCDIAGLPIYQLLEQASTAPARHTEFTPEQDNAFFAHPSLLSYFSELVYENRSPSQIAADNSLTDAATHLYLRTLEDIGLIDLLVENNYRLNVSLPLGFSSESKVLKAQYQELIEHTVEQVIHQPKSDAFCLVKPINLSDRLYDKMLEELSNIIDKYAEISELTMSENSHEPRQVMILSCDAWQGETSVISNDAANALNIAR